MSNTVVVGIDGATRRLIQPWLDDGELPAISRILEEGISGELESVLPPVTSPNWKAYATGKNPGKIGVYWWKNVDVENRRLHLPIERFHGNTEYWELLEEEYRVGVINVPTTYPPKPVGEFLISGAPDGDDSGFAHPRSLERRLRRDFDYRVTTRRPVNDGTDEVYEEILELIDLRFRVAKRLARESDLDFLHVTTFYINALHHRLWNDEYVERGWQIVDDHLAEFLEDEERNVVLMSDHGHAEIERVFYVNEWLARNGYLAYDDGVADRLHDRGITKDRLRRTLVRVEEQLPGSIDVRGAAERLAPQWFLSRLPNSAGKLRTDHDLVDWERTDAIASAMGPVYLTVDRDDPRYESLREELLERFRSLTDPDGRPIARAVYRGEAVYDGPYLDEAPDIVIDSEPSTILRETLGGERTFAPSDDSWAGTNRREGLFAGYGPDFDRGTVDGLSILDLAPTLLHLYGEAVPDDMDGTVRRDLFAAGSEAREREPTFRSGDHTTPKRPLVEG